MFSNLNLEKSMKKIKNIKFTAMNNTRTGKIKILKVWLVFKFSTKYDVINENNVPIRITIK